MIVGVLKLTFDIPWANSLKDKRMVVRSLTTRLRDKFGVSVAEVDAQDVHRTAVLGVACVGSAAGEIDSVLDHILNWLEVNSEAAIRQAEREFR
ncbi:MAG: DUF503 domain-containing protein [Oscillospiraceae bacterium]|nr:DUF503 domain-containing protein [Oscillospiraceae bacterium]